MDTGELNVKIDNGIIQKANQDKNGNDIPSTYATKNELNKASLWKVENGVLKPKDLNEITLDDLASETQYVSEIVRAIMGDNFLPIDGTAKKAISDKNGNDIANTYFPKSGGELSGNTIYKVSDDDFISLKGGSATRKGGSLWLYGENYSIERYAGKFFLMPAVPQGDTDAFSLTGGSDGSLTWLNKDLAGSAIVAKSSGPNGYVKYASGLIIQWLQQSFDAMSARTDIECYYPISFSSDNFMTIPFGRFAWGNHGSASAGLYVPANPRNKINLAFNTDVGNGKFSIIAIGY